MYQPKIQERHIRRLYVKAKREGKKMTHLVNEALAAYLEGEPEPPEEGSTHGRMQRSRGISHRAGGRQGTGGAPDCSPHESVPAEHHDSSDPPSVCGSHVQSRGGDRAV